MPSFLNKLSCVSGRSSSPITRSSRGFSLRRGRSSRRSSTSSNRMSSRPSAPPSANGDVNAPNSLANEISTQESESKSFWDIGNYKFALRRCDNGQRLGEELADMISERAKLEENYSKSLKQWHKKWSEHLDNESGEYETTKTAWQSFLDAGYQTSEIHSDVAKSLTSKPVLKIQQWLKKKYEKHFFSFKQTKEFEHDFSVAAKPYAEQIEKLKKLKKEYYDSIKASKSAEDASIAGEPNPKLSQDQKERLVEKAKGARENQERAMKRYKDQLVQIDLYKPTHMEKMIDVFNRTQNFEHDRMMFFKQTFLECYDIMQIHNDERFDIIFNNYVNQINKMNPKQDLDWWSRTYGPDTKPNWPMFEEYQEN